MAGPWPAAVRRSRLPRRAGDVGLPVPGGRPRGAGQPRRRPPLPRALFSRVRRGTPPPPRPVVATAACARRDRGTVGRGAGTGHGDSMPRADSPVVLRSAAAAGPADATAPPGDRRCRRARRPPRAGHRPWTGSGTIPGANRAADGPGRRPRYCRVGTQPAWKRSRIGRWEGVGEQHQRGARRARARRRNASTPRYGRPPPRAGPGRCPVSHPIPVARRASKCRKISGGADPVRVPVGHGSTRTARAVGSDGGGSSRVGPGARLPRSPSTAVATRAGRPPWWRTTSATDDRRPRFTTRP